MFAKALLPAHLDGAKQLMISVLSFSTLRSEASEIFGAAACLVLLDYDNASFPENAQRHADRLFQHSSQNGQVSDPYSAFVENPHDVGADRERYFRFVLELDSERQEYLREQRR